jgi:WD40 repeat protein
MPTSPMSEVIRHLCRSVLLHGTGLTDGQLLDVASGKEIAGLAGFTAAFSPDGKTLATGTSTGLLKFWNLATGKEQASLEAHGGPVTSLVFSPDGKTLATVSNGDDSVRLWVVATAKERGLLKQATSVTTSLALPWVAFLVRTTASWLFPAWLENHPRKRREE